MNEALFNRAVILEPRNALGKGGVESYGTAVTYPARVEYKTKMIRGKDGTDKVSTARVYVGPEVPVLATDRITLPDGAHPEIMEVRPVYGMNDIDHKVIYL